MGDSVVCRTLREEDEGTVRRLVESTFSVFSLGKFWDWRYLRNPNSDRSLVAVAECDGKIVGCNHWIPRRVRLSNSVELDSMLGASIVVAPGYRKKGVGRALIHFLRSQHDEKKPSLMYMFTDPELRKHFHTPIGGYVPVPSGTMHYKKILNWNKVKTNVAAFNQRVKRGEFADLLTNVNLTVSFNTHCAPPLCLHLDSKGLKTCTSVESADVIISGDVGTFDRVRGEHNGLRMLIGPLLRGRLRFRGNLRKVLAVYRNRWVFKEILSGKIA